MEKTHRFITINTLGKALCCFSLFALSLNTVKAEGRPDYPMKPIRLLTAEIGGGSDYTARLIAQPMSESLGQSIVIDNRPGGVIIGELAAKANHDGYTLLLYSGSLWQMPYMRERVQYNIKQFTPIIFVSASPLIAVVHPSVPVKSIPELINLAKTKPGILNYASGPLGAAPHLAGELFKYLARVDIVHIPFKGVGLAVNEVISGRVQLMFTSVGAGVPQIKNGRLRALAVTSPEPSKLLPELPTVASAGLPGFEAGSNNGFFAPAGTARSIILRLNQIANKAMEKNEIQDKFFNVGMELIGGPPERFTKLIQEDSARTGKLIQAARIRAE